MDKHDTNRLHIKQVDVEKIPLSPNKVLYHISDRFLINDLDDEGKEIWKEVQPGENVYLGQEHLVFPPQIFFGNERITLSAYDVYWAKTFRKGFFSAEKRVFCNQIPFRAEPGTLTGIMGPSGAGKTVLLNLLSGYICSPRNYGQVFINGSYDVHKERRILGRTIGYVPQDDTLIPQLTVQQSLDYCFQLRYSGVPNNLQQHIIEDACQKAGFSRESLPDLLAAKIGSPDEKTLSGGERKRVNIAHELIRHPLLLFLDEPTSGLSSVDADTVTQSLKELCTRTNITIILTIHQPSRESFDLLDRLLIVNQGGNLAYLGDPQDAVAYFAGHAGMTYQARQNPAEFILRALNRWTASLAASNSVTALSPEKSITEAYYRQPGYFSFNLTESLLETLRDQGMASEALERLAPLKNRRFLWRSEYRKTLKTALGQGYDVEQREVLRQVVQKGHPVRLSDIHQERLRDIPNLSTSFFQQFRVLFRRNRSVTHAEIKTRLFQSFQPIAIALLMLLAFSWYSQDYYSEDIFARVGCYFTQKVKQGQQIRTWKDLPIAKAQAYSQPHLMSEGAANRRAAIFFLLVAACIWLGIINSCQEIVAERTVVKREAKSIVRIFPYLVAKIIFLGYICLKQSLLLLAIIFLPNMLLTTERWRPLFSEGFRNLLLKFQLFPKANFFYGAAILAILFITTCVASWMGLGISAFAPTPKTALTMVPLLIIPQLLLGGLIRPIKDIGRPESIMLTPQAFSELRRHVPDTILDQLQDFKNRPFAREHDFVVGIRSRIGDNAMADYRDMLVEQARVTTRWDRALFYAGGLHHLMLQKWAFKALLLYDSLGRLRVLKKIVDFDRYREYEYIQFEEQRLVEMFFPVSLDSAYYTAQEYQNFLADFPDATTMLQDIIHFDRVGNVSLQLSDLSERERQALPRGSEDNILAHRAPKRQIYALLTHTFIIIVVLYGFFVLVPTYWWLRKSLLT
ncbi:hypothetical protein CSB45_02925 [candidate division KSB3 bacterium]|uniref:ABC transporter domain-containing protein n=1 Tax=candidate division KSB3 bacterium TaxID=2044937 RepID=A0A2G6E8Z2_9BACT|nr:MAG: hypothetical protein CSB45_02925 [candidate division KSB3 bacterium]PIE29008.1 MAG: hypothetical protein CSA57_11155 [candidate division KSB3 bacterium]